MIKTTGDWFLDFVVWVLQFHFTGSMVSFGIMLWRYFHVWTKIPARPKFIQMVIFALCVGWLYTIDILEYHLRQILKKKKKK